MIDCVALALDFSSKEEVESFLNLLQPKPKFLKVGLELTSALGIENTLNFLNDVSPESKIFLDLKLHDIPNTVAQTISSIKKLGCNNLEFLTVHASGGSDMLKRSLIAAEDSFNIVAVTVLTSHSKASLKNDFNIEANIEVQDIVNRLVDNSVNSGIKWFVSSVREAKQLKIKFPQIKLITPGIRFSDDNQDDQSRVATPSEARANGSDLLVIGRSVTKAKEPEVVWKKLIN